MPKSGQRRIVTNWIECLAAARRLRSDGELNEKALGSRLFGSFSPPVKAKLALAVKLEKSAKRKRSSFHFHLTLELEELQLLSQFAQRSGMFGRRLNNSDSLLLVAQKAKDALGERRGRRYLIGRDLEQSIEMQDKFVKEGAIDHRHRTRLRRRKRDLDSIRHGLLSRAKKEPN